MKRLLVFAGAVAAVTEVVRRRGAAGQRLAPALASARSALSRQPKLDDLTKEELYRKAQEADVHGRSEMTKEELVEALKEE